MPAKVLVLMCLLFVGFWLPCDGLAQDLDGQWYGVAWDAANEFVTDYLSMTLDVVGGTGTADIYIPAVGAFHETLPVTVVGDAITIGNPAVFGLTGTIAGEVIEGEGWQAGFVIGTWYIEKDVGAPMNPGPAPGPTCPALPPLLCTGGVERCFEVIQFEPDEGPGYWDYPIPGETYGDQAYSFLRRDAIMAIKYAAAKVDCKTEFWDYGSLAPLGFGDMSEEDGSTPGTNIGNLRHPPGTHVDGNDIDTAYYQVFSPDNYYRAVGDSYLGGVNQLHLVGDPHLLDVWRSALFIAYLAEHPNLRVVGVDGRIGPLLENAFDGLVTLGWIDQGLRDSIPLAYEVTNQGHGWYLFHHTHMHVSMEFVLFADGFESGHTGAWSVVQ